MPSAVTLEVEGSLAVLRLGRAHGNAINGELVEGLLTAVAEVERAGELRGALLAAEGKLFCPGLDLQELIELDPAEMERFLTRFNAAVRALYGFSKPLVAAIHGHAIAGGAILALTADWKVLRTGALVGLNELRVGVPFPYGVSVLLREQIAPARRTEVALFGRNFSDDEAVAAGLADELHPAGDFEAYCKARLEELASRELGAFAITKRDLREHALARMRAGDAEHARDFLDAWFSPGTRERLGAVVAQLRSRG